MHDGAPCHKAKKVVRFLEQHPIKVLEWPELLAPNEKKRTMKEKKTPNQETLKEKLTPICFRNLSGSMPKRFAVGYNKQSQHMTKY